MKRVYNCSEYAIYLHEADTEDVKQYEIHIKDACKAKDPRKGIDRDLYSQIENGIRGAQKMAKETIKEYFLEPRF